MAERMRTRERYLRVFDHKEPDCVPMKDSAWGETVARWHREGLPTDVNYVDYFDLDHVSRVGMDESPRFPTETLEETDEYVVRTTKYGATDRVWKHAAGVPEQLDFYIKDWDTWNEAKARIEPSRDRIPWDRLKQNYRMWKERGDFLELGFWFGFDVTHSRIIGTERCLMAMVEDPEWLMDIFNTQLETNMALFQMVLDEGYEFDAIGWPDDMGYKHSQFFSLKTYREILKPFHKRACEWAHERGMKAMLHSCGDVNPFIEDLIEIGVDCLNPLEVKAGMDPIHIKQNYGDQLVIHGGVNAVLWDKPEAIMAEMEKVIPILKEGGGYIFASDHSIPASVSFDDFSQIVGHYKRLATY